MTNETVLIVEDEAAIAELLATALTDSGYRVVLAANGRRALAHSGKGPTPDLVISDVMMPVLDGAGFIRTMREIEPPLDIPFIITSSIRRLRCSPALPDTQDLSESPSRLRP